MTYEHDDISYIVKSQQDMKIAKALLSPIGLKCTWNLFECAVFKDNKVAVAITPKDGTCSHQAYSATFSNPGTLLDFLMQRIIIFLFADGYMKNPYFGCKNLEEAAVKADLIEMQMKKR